MAITRPEQICSFRPVRDAADGELLAPVVLPWLYEAGGTYLDWLFGGPEMGRATVAEWMQRRDSELSVLRVTVLLDDGGEAVGGFLALDGAELARCRAADALAVMRALGRNRAALHERLRTSAGLRGAVGPDEFYLSRIGVLKTWRGRGFGRMLAREYLRSGRRRGFRTFSLDVEASNMPAVSLYRSLGFRVSSETSSPEAGITLLRMTRSVRP